MSLLTPLALVLATAVAWSVLDAFRKVLAQRLAPEALVLWLVAGQLPLLAAGWHGAETPGALDLGYALVALAAIGLNIVANLAFVAAVRRGELSVVIPLLSLTPVAVSLLAIPILGELPRALQVVGIGLTVAAAFVLTGGSVARARSAPGVGAMLVVVLCWSLTLPLDKIGVSRAGPSLHGLVLCSGMMAAMIALLASKRRLGELVVPRSTWGWLAGAIVVATVALVTQLLAIEHTLVSVVETVKRAVGNFGSLALGMIVFGEKLDFGRAVALATMALGAGLVLLG